MNTESREHLSAFMDGEVTPDSARFLVRRLVTDDALRNTWSRYHLIRDCLRQQDGEFAAPELRERLNQALAAEPAPGARVSGRWLRPALGAAIAASVALAAVLVVAPERSPQPGPASAPPNRVAAAAPEPFVSPNIGGLVPVSQPVNLSGTEASGAREINAYLLRHYQVTGSAGGRGFVSFMPIVATHGVAARADAGASLPASRKDESRNQ